MDICLHACAKDSARLSTGSTATDTNDNTTQNHAMLTTGNGRLDTLAALSVIVVAMLMFCCVLLLLMFAVV